MQISQLLDPRFRGDDIFRVSLTVSMQEVVSGEPESLHRCYSTDSSVGTVPVVMMDPTLKHSGTLHGMVVGKAVSPFSEGRLNESLGFPVGAGCVWLGEDVLQAQALSPGSDKSVASEIRGNFFRNCSSNFPALFRSNDWC